VKGFAEFESEGWPATLGSLAGTPAPVISGSGRWRLRAAGTGGPAPTSRLLQGHAPRAATTFENTFAIWLPMVKRITMTTIETSTRIKEYSTIPWPLWRRIRFLNLTTTSFLEI